MKRRSKVLAALLVLALVLGLTACGGKKQTPQEVYKAALEKMNELPGMDANMEMTMTMGDGSESLDIAITAAIKMKDMYKESMAMDMLMEISLMGMSMEMQAYYADGYYLMEMMGQKVKYAMSMDEAMEQAQGMNQEFNADTLGEIEMTEENGVKTLTYQVDLSKMKEDNTLDEYMAILESMGLGDLTDAADIDFTSMAGTMTVNKDGYVTGNDVHMVCTMDMNGTTVDCEYQVNLTYNNPGQDVEVEIPDASEYIEVDPSVLG